MIKASVIILSGLCFWWRFINESLAVIALLWLVFRFTHLFINYLVSAGPKIRD